MYKLLISAILLAATLQLGISMKDIFYCRDSHCAQLLEKHSREVLRIDWKPISVFPEEAKRFR